MSMGFSGLIVNKFTDTFDSEAFLRLSFIRVQTTYFKGNKSSFQNWALNIYETGMSCFTRLGYKIRVFLMTFSFVLTPCPDTPICKKCLSSIYIVHFHDNSKNFSVGSLVQEPQF